MATAQRQRRDSFARPDPVAVARLCHGLRLGLPERKALTFAGVLPSVLALWRRKAGEGEPDFVLAVDEIDLAPVQAEADLLEDVQRSEDWRSKSWLLERRWPDQYGPPAHRVDVAASIQVGESRAGVLKALEITLREAGPEAAMRLAVRFRRELPAALLPAPEDFASHA